VILRKSGNRAAFEVCPSFLVQRGAQKCSGRQEEANGGMKFSFKKTAFLRLVFFGGGSKNTVEKIRGSVFQVFSREKRCVTQIEFPFPLF
jgi:hypothetical protein